jgi:hypothetical protein
MNKALSFQRREFKGSRLRCLMATSLPAAEVAEFLNALVQPFAQVTAADQWHPRGLLDADEIQLSDAVAFLMPEQRAELISWWLAKPERANTPNWDIVSTCRIENTAGLILVEAKAHAAELGRGGKPDGNADNELQIEAAVSEANDALGGASSQWRLSCASHYQMCNRFAWAWKVASFGIPVVLVYLGFLRATEMGEGAFPDHAAWSDCVTKHALEIAPPNIWDRRIPVGNGSLTPTIRSARIIAAVEANAATSGSREKG